MKNLIQLPTQLSKSSVKELVKMARPSQKMMVFAYTMKKVCDGIYKKCTQYMVDQGVEEFESMNVKASLVSRDTKKLKDDVELQELQEKVAQRKKHLIEKGHYDTITSRYWTVDI